MEPVSASLTLKILKAVGPAAGRWVWQKVRTPPQTEAFLRVSAHAMAEAAISVLRGTNLSAEDSQLRKWNQEAVGVLVDLLTSALDLEDLVNRFLLEPISTGDSPAVKDLPVMIVDRFRENGGDITTAVIPVEEIASRFVVVLPGMLSQEAAHPGSPLAGFIIISSLSQIKSQLRQGKTDPYETMTEAIGLLRSVDPARMQLGISVLSDVIKTNQEYRQAVIDILCAFLTNSSIPQDWDSDSIPDDYRWIRGQAALEELIWESIPPVSTSPRGSAPKIVLNLTGARLLNVNLVGRQVERLKLDGAIIYGNALFADSCITENASFERAEFRGIANFERTSFGGRVAFVRTIFCCGAALGGAHFSGEVGFRSVAFEEDLILGSDPDGPDIFTSTIFDADLTFYDVGCGGRMALEKVNCAGSVSISGSNILDSLSLRSGHFLGGLTIRDVSTTSDLILERAHVMEELRLSLQEFRYADLSEMRAGASQDIYVDERVTEGFLVSEKNSRSFFQTIE
jgi:uncharacterized protein YjbI with pentapeptide repeats